MGRRGFTLIELLVIVAILAVMVSIGVGTISAGKGAARVKGASRDVFAAIRHARSIALVTGQPAIITYSTVEEDGEVMAKVEITSAKLFDTDAKQGDVQTLSGEPLQGEGYELVHIEKEGGDAIKSRAAKSQAASGAEQGGPEQAGPAAEGGGETLEEVLFKPVDAEVVKGMRLKVVKGEDDPQMSGNTGRKPRISVFSNVDYLLGKFKDAKDAAKKKEAAAAEKKDEEKDGSDSPLASENQEPVSIVWETNGRVDPHQIWVYSDGQKPEDGLLIRVDRFGAAKVVSGDGEDDDE